MRTLLRWTGIALLCVAGLAVVAYAGVYVVSERLLRRSYTVPPVTLDIPADQQSILEGRRLAIVHGCFNGCHGRSAEGVVFFDQPAIGRIIAPNLTAAIRRYDVAQIVAAVRNGVGPDGRGLLIMPAEAFNGMTDADVGRIIAFLRTLPPAVGPGPGVSLGPVGRIGLAIGKFKMAPRLIAETVPPPTASGEQAELGRHLARTVCVQCHGTSLRGDSTPDFTSPDLRVVAGYSKDAFSRLLREGIGIGDRKLGVMGAWARSNLSALTDAEIAALYDYLHGLHEIAHD